MNLKYCALALVSSLLLCGDLPAAQEQRSPNASQNSESVDINEILKNPSGFTGKQVRVDGEVDRVLGPHAFVVQKEVPGPNPSMLVISLVPYWEITGTLQNSSNVHLEGQVYNYSQSQFEREYGRLNAPEIKPENITQPVLLIGIQEQKQAGLALTDAASNNAAAQSRTNPVPTKLDTVLDNPGNFYGKYVTVTGTVNHIESNYAFVMHDDVLIRRDEILVLGLQPLNTVVPQLQKDRPATVSGVVRHLYPAEFQWKREQFGASEDLWNRFIGKAVLVTGEGASSQPGGR